MGLEMLIPLGIAAASGTASAVGNRKAARTSTENSQYNREGTQTTSSADQAEFSPLRDLLLGTVSSRLGGGGLPHGFIEKGIQGINNNAGFAQQSLENRLSSRGLLGSKGYGAGSTAIENARFGGINDLELFQAPNMAREYQNQDIGNALKLFSLQHPTVTTNTSQSGTGSGTAVGPGSAFGSGLGSAANLMAYFYGKGLFG